ncbi:MAG: YaiO family outer membrane beta-barrel protein [Candidatus Eisenbacteria bacterium]|nr:YaiO family outer membrane beta-barrel protein [Candidatus Eisenbacteria bacterium]
MGIAPLAPPAGAQTDGDAAAEAQPPLEQAIEGGVGYSEFTRGYGDAHYMFARYTIERPYDWRWRIEVGSASRFGDSSLDGGVSFTKFLWGETNLTLGIGSGTGDYIASEYRFDASLAQPIFGTLLRLGYTREQSKAENYRDGYGVALERWFPHWIVEAHWRYDIGHPGDTISRTVGFGLTYFVWERFYVGAGVELGDVSYLQVGPTDFLVNYDSEEYQLGFSYWMTPQIGIGFRTTYGETSFYEVTGFELSFTRRW